MVILRPISRFLMIGSLLAASAVSAAPADSFDVTVEIFTLPRKKIWTYRLTPGAVSIFRRAVDAGRDTTAYRRDLSENQRRSLGRFFRRFPLERLESNYIGERYQGETFYAYHIQINKIKKDIYVYYARPDELLDLNRALNRLLPREFHLWSEKEP